MILPAPIDRFLTVNGVQLHYLEWEGVGPPVLLLHATGFHAHLWDPIARLLSGRFRLLVPDARGHGDSEKPETGYEWSVFIEDIIAFLDALNVRGAIAVGHSMGATTLAGAASRRPDLFERIVLLDLVLFPRELRGLPEAHNPMVAAARKRRQHWPNREELFRHYHGRPPFDTWREECFRLYIEHGTGLETDGSVRLKCPGEIEAQVFAGGVNYDAWSQLNHVAASTLLVRGELSPTFPERVAVRALGRLRRGKLVALSGPTHFIPMEEPEKVASMIAEFASSPAPTR